MGDTYYNLHICCSDFFFAYIMLGTMRLLPLSDGYDHLFVPNTTIKRRTSNCLVMLLIVMYIRMLGRNEDGKQSIIVGTFLFCVVEKEKQKNQNAVSSIISSCCHYIFKWLL